MAKTTSPSSGVWTEWNRVLRSAVAIYPTRSENAVSSDCFMITERLITSPRNPDQQLHLAISDADMAKKQFATSRNP
jgi:hypothetical protein